MANFVHFYSVTNHHFNEMVCEAGKFKLICMEVN